MNDVTGANGRYEESEDFEELDQTELLIERIDLAHFSPARFREGYEPDQVDACLLRLRAALEGDIALDPILAESRFTLRGFRDGYDTSLVDLFLLELARDARSDVEGGEVPPPPSPRETDHQGYMPQFAARSATTARRGFLRRKRNAG